MSTCKKSIWQNINREMLPDSFIISEQTKSIKALSFNMHYAYACFIWVAINVPGAYAYAWIEILMPDLLISTHELWQVTKECHDKLKPSKECHDKLKPSKECHDKLKPSKECHDKLNNKRNVRTN